jgi:hypothetical protein
MNLKYYRVGPLISIILLLAVGLDNLIEGWIVPFLIEHGVAFMRAPGNASIIGGILVLYDKVLWKYPFFNLLVKTPYMAGRYQGFISYEWEGKPNRKDCVVEVIQTASKIKMFFYFNNGQDQKTFSHSLIEDIRQEDDGNFGVYIFYINGGSKKDGVLDCHEGANKLRYLPGKKKQKAKLTGHYFTNRNIQTRGEMEVDFISRNIKGKF